MQDVQILETLLDLCSFQVIMLSLLIDLLNNKT